MNRNTEKIYFRSPITIQNLAVSAYGYLLYTQRYGGRAAEYLHQLRNSQSFGKSELERLQVRELQRILHHAFASVPYYRALSRQRNLCAEDFSSLSDIQKLPILTKEQIRNSPSTFRSDWFIGRGRALTLNTSGTTGKPLTIYCDKESRRRHYAFWTRLREWFGILPGMTRATFFGRIVVSPEQVKPPFWRYDAFQKNVLFSSYHMSEPNLEYYYKRLVEIQPDELIGYPSSLFILAKYLKQNKLGGISPRAVFTTAETLLEHHRDLIEEVFERKVIDQYGCTEMALFVSQCEKGTYHIHPEHGIVEVVDSEGNPVPPGTEGEVVCTGFVNYAMPMIRYRLGDTLIMSEDRCPCGRSFPVIKHIVGRVDDILVTPDGRPLGRLDPVFKGMSGIYETQIIQSGPARLLLKIVIDPSFTEKNRDDLLYEVWKRSGSAMKVDIEVVDSIPKSKNGKFRSVVSNISS
jgi:phenylacetate-CoA ligase